MPFLGSLFFWDCLTSCLCHLFVINLIGKILYTSNNRKNVILRTITILYGILFLDWWQLLSLLCQVAKDVEGFKTAKVTDESRAAKDVESRPAEDVDELKLTNDIAKENLAKDIEELNSKLNVVELNLSEVSLFHPRLLLVVL